jgi:hypothetical protein
LGLRPIFLLYSPKCLEGEFCELRLDGVLQRVALILNRVRPWMHKKAYSGTKEERESSHNQVVGQ